MVDLILGMLAAVGAATLYSLGVALQAMDAKQTPAHVHLHIALAGALLRRSRWLLGTGLSIAGWPLQLLALMLAPLIVVQPTLAAGLLVLMIAGERMLGERAGRREHIAMSAIIIGVAGAAITSPGHSTKHAGAMTLLLVLGALGLASLIPYLLRMLGRTNASVTIIGAGLAFGWSGVATKLASDELLGGALGHALIWALATALVSGVGALSEMSALQSRPAIQVAPVVFVTQTAVPLVLAPVILGEGLGSTPLAGAPLAGALALLVAGATMLARSPLLLALMEAERSADGSGSTEAQGAKARRGAGAARLPS